MAKEKKDRLFIDRPPYNTKEDREDKLFIDRPPTPNWKRKK